MRNPLPFTWVKNVYSLRMISGIDSGNTIVSYTPPTLASIGLWVQTPIYTQLTTKFSAVLSTLNIPQLHLLIRHLYPVSTVPTIKKKKENKERNS